MNAYMQRVLEEVKARNANEPLFLQTVEEVFESLEPIVEKNGAAKPNVCIQCGKCMKVCENEAITQNPKTGVYMINKKKCVSCGKCVEVCPMKVMVMPEGGPASKCIACGICVKACPMEVLEIVEK